MSWATCALFFLSAIALIFIPMIGVPGALIGGVIGQWYDRRFVNQNQQENTSQSSRGTPL